MSDSCAPSCLDKPSGFNPPLLWLSMSALHVPQTRSCHVCVNPDEQAIRSDSDEIQALYGNTSITQLELVYKIQKILQNLYETGRSFPPALVLDFNRPLQTVTRTGASLYLMLFQALQPLPAALGRLCETCNEAATKSLAILHALKRQQTIPRYGFFDLDATFSGAFVLVMMGLIDKTRDQPPPALDQAFDVLRFLSRAGNLAAERRLQDITHSCMHVWPNHILGADRQQGEQVDSGSLSAISLSSLGPRGDASVPHTSASAIPPQPPQYTTVAAEGWEQGRDESRLLETWMHPDTANATFDMQVDWDWHLDLSVEAEGIYSSFFDPSLPLTGVDHLDWQEIEKIFNGQNDPYVKVQIHLYSFLRIGGVERCQMTACSPLNSLQGCRYCIFSFGMQYRSIHTSV
ncbi:unnamed protein product [Aspergillus oryzae RIB40]|uniref:DNA, SC113 n=1 Tax=Aspergillus oryzae (strain ATCC 42149 / RIB 40) TaxID=510516 RepID=Q2U6N9_ASPOR|nr:unnamed protein product [Aspergillus oryzae RIB40]BAE62776.1 unnamed protein product [Aspergillus oryzae RIB40]